METIFAAICAAVLSNAVTVSDATIAACVKQEMPKVAKSGDKFLAGGAGREMNFILANANYFAFIAEPAAK